MTATRPSGRGTFQSTPSAWRVTLRAWLNGYQGLISIHTLRVEGDLVPGRGI